MAKFILFLGLFLTIQVYGQNVSESFEGNNFRWFENTNANLFYDQNEYVAGFEVPINGNNNAIFAQTFWIGGLSPDDSLHLSANGFRCNNPNGFCKYTPGPIRLDGTADTSGTYFESFNRFWHITRAEIDENTSYFDCLDDPNCDTDLLFPNGYEIPEAFQNWPAQGNTDDGYAAYIAPFVDRNNDGEYDPEDGDHPKICGDFEVYSIANDVGLITPDIDGKPLKIELHTMVYGYDSSDPVLFNTLFVKRKIINRSSMNYHDVYIGLWTDFDLGNFADDYVGTDVSRNMIFAYNGDNNDEGSSSGPGYGTNPPAIGLKLLSGPLLPANGEDDNKLYPGYEIYANQSRGWEDGIIDNERVGLSSSVFHANNGDSPIGDPQTPHGYYNYMRGILLNDSAFYYGVGYGPNLEGLTPAHYYLPGASDPLMAGTDGIDPQYPVTGGWTEENAGNPPGDRRMLASTGPFNLSAGSSQFIDYAIIFAEESDNGVFDVLDTLRSYADAIQGQQCSNGDQYVTGISEVKNIPDGVTLFPNPTTGKINIDFSGIQNNLFIKVYDISGRLIQQEKFGYSHSIQIDIIGEKGMYILEIDSKENHFSRKVILN